MGLGNYSVMLGIKPGVTIYKTRPCLLYYYSNPIFKSLMQGTISVFCRITVKKMSINRKKSSCTSLRLVRAISSHLQFFFLACLAVDHGLLLALCSQSFLSWLGRPYEMQGIKPGLAAWPASTVHNL